jgi:pyruvate formate lyase activating enzyme
MHEAMLYQKDGQGGVTCQLCAHGCHIKDGGLGLCRVRQNQGGTLYSLVYGKPIAANLDPIEKKPLFHFLPGSMSFSVATVGCNFQCGFCQNWNISQEPREGGGGLSGGGPGGALVPPEALVAQALAQDAASISYTYTEPTIYFEYAHDCMKLAKDKGLKNVFVSNGYQSAQCLEACQGLLDAANIDLKAFRDEFYKSECKARLAPVLDTLRRLRAMGVWLEVTTLLIPGQNDDPDELAQLAGFLAKELSPEVPWHVSAYTPRYKYEGSGIGPTPAASLEKALVIGREAGLLYVYAGNLFGHASETTFCPSCRQPMVERRGYQVSRVNLMGGACPACGRAIAGVWA